jgi:tetratricopeptide (TPR) repeat protein
MADTNQASEYALVAKARQLLDKGDISAAVECYQKVHEPDAEDEREARNMLIEARAHLSRKHVLEALEHFEEALVMGTDVQRRQALDGITKIGEIKTKLGPLTKRLKKGLDDSGVSLKELGLALLSAQENVVLITGESAEKLPASLTKGSKISRLPQHLTEQALPFATDRCIPYADDEDVRYIIDVAVELSKISKDQN